MKQSQKRGSVLLATLTVVLMGAAPGASGAPGRPLGTLMLGAPTTIECPTGFTCTNFTVICPGLAQITGSIGDQKPTVQTRGLVLFFSGSVGGSFWSSNGTTGLALPFLQSLLDNGFEIVQVRWGDSGWLVAASGVPSGQEALACRPATAIQWVHDNLYAPLGLQGAFYLTGNSAGASQITYALSSYGTAGIVDLAVPTSGPTFAAISKGCLLQQGYAYTVSNQTLIDSSFGYTGPAWGPCVAHSASFAGTWIANSVETGGIQYNYPATRVHIIVGGEDDLRIRDHVDDYYQVLLQAQQPMVAWQLVPGMGHTIQDSADGLSALFTALTATPTPGPSPTPAATPTPTPSATPLASPTATPTPTPTPVETPTPTSTPLETPTPTPITISGTVTYCSNPTLPPVPNVTMTLTGSPSDQTLSDGSGNYQFASLAAGGSYTVTPTKATLPSGSAGINTLDVIAAQRQFLNLGTPLTGCRLTAADVSPVAGDGVVNTLDVIAIQRFFLSQPTGLGRCGKYQFNPTSRSYSGITTDQTAQNYDALVFGDTAGSPYVH
jgi:hypothetical protein